MRERARTCIVSGDFFSGPLESEKILSGQDVSGRRARTSLSLPKSSSMRALSAAIVTAMLRLSSGLRTWWG